MIHDVFTVPDAGDVDRRPEMPIIERGGGARPVVRAAMRRWIKARYAAGDDTDRIHAGALLLTAVVGMFIRGYPRPV
jgi:hypothetical protein